MVYDLEKSLLGEEFGNTGGKTEKQTVRKVL
jgi:hypothetical protein